MKIGLISDIHGDLKALEQAFWLLEKRHHVDSIWCAGDLVGRGRESDDVVARIKQAAIPTVLGNHDELAIRQQQRGQIQHYQQETINTLIALPRTYRVQLDKRNVVMVHGTPLSNQQSLRLILANQEKVQLWLQKVNAHILITGHTHVPMSIQGWHGMVANPGSLFNPRDFDRASSETYGILDVKAMTFVYYPLWD